jgi:hypothetical protein
MKARKPVSALLSLILMISLSGCAEMTDEQQRMLSGGTMGAAGGAALGVLTGGSALLGAAIGGAGGVVGGALVSQHQKAKASKGKKNTKSKSDAQAKESPD